VLKSSVCQQEQLESDAFRGWVAETKEPFRLHRKCWEFAYISQALHERGMLADGRHLQRIQPPRLGQDRIGHPDLAHIVQLSRELDLRHGRRIQA